MIHGIPAIATEISKNEKKITISRQPSAHSYQPKQKSFMLKVDR